MKNILIVSALSFCLVQPACAKALDSAKLDNGYFAKVFIKAHPDYCPEIYTASYTNYLDDTESCKTLWAELNANNQTNANANPTLRALMVIDGLGGQKQDAKKALAFAMQDGVTAMYPDLISDIKYRISHPSLHDRLSLYKYASSESDYAPVDQAASEVQASATEYLLDTFISKNKLNSDAFANLVNLYNSLIDYANAHTSENGYPAAGDSSGNENLAQEDYLKTEKKFRQLLQNFTHDPSGFISKNNNSSVNDALLSAKYADAKKLEQTPQCQADPMCAKILDPQQPWHNYRQNFIEFAQNYCAQLDANKIANKTEGTNVNTCGSYSQQQIAQSISIYLTKERLNDINAVINSIRNPD